MGVKIKCRTDHKSLESWVKKDFDRMSGPVGRPSRWHQFPARFPLEDPTSRGKTMGRRMCFLGRHILLTWPTPTPSCMGAMRTRRVGINGSGKLRSGSSQSSQG